MKFNKKQLNVLFNAATTSKTAQVLWDMLLGDEYDFGYGLKPSPNWHQKDVVSEIKDRKILAEALRQLADAIEASPPALDPECGEAKALKKKAKK